jgi:hypothetical protein
MGLGVSHGCASDSPLLPCGNRGLVVEQGLFEAARRADSPAVDPSNLAQPFQRVQVAANRRRRYLEPIAELADTDNLILADDLPQPFPSLGRQIPLLQSRQFSPPTGIVHMLDYD